jgi:GTP 3',8-cyclase
MAIDRFGRNIHYLRISLTDHCNMRCVYCMPEDMTFRPSAELMQDDELMLLTRLFVRLGFDKFRLTGGEPTVRARIVDIVREMTVFTWRALAIDDHQWSPIGQTCSTP